MSGRSKLIGINHVALEVGDLDAAIDWYGRIFELEFRNRFERMAFVAMGDQFLALAQVEREAADNERHFGLVVDDKEAVRERLTEVGIEPLATRGLEFLDPWGNRVQIVDYREIQFLKDPRILESMGASGLQKTDEALAELSELGVSD